MKRYNYILLDWDGSLVRTLDIWQAALKTALERRGHSFSDVVIGANFTAFRRRMAALGVDDIDAMVREAHEITDREVLNVALYPDTLATLEALHEAEKKIALVTTSTHGQVDTLLTHYRLQALLDQVVCGDDVTQHKPDPEPLEKALSLLGAVKEEAIILGDSANDIASAHAVGIDSVLFFPPEHARFYDIEDLRKLKPTYVIADLRELIRIAA